VNNELQPSRITAMVRNARANRGRFRKYPTRNLRLGQPQGAGAEPGAMSETKMPNTEGGLIISTLTRIGRADIKTETLHRNRSKTKKQKKGAGGHE